MDDQWKNKILCAPLFSYLDLFCVKAICVGMKYGHRNNGAEIIVISCRLDALSKEEAFKIGKKYHSKCEDVSNPEKKFLFEEVKRWVDHVYKKKDGQTFWACSRVNKIGKCIFNHPQGIQRGIEILLIKEPDNPFYISLKKQLEKHIILTEKQKWCIKEDFRKKICRV